MNYAREMKLSAMKERELVALERESHERETAQQLKQLMCKKPVFYIQLSNGQDQLKDKINEWL